jgi:hypothetical protein
VNSDEMNRLLTELAQRASSLKEFSDVPIAIVRAARQAREQLRGARADILGAVDVHKLQWTPFMLRAAADVQNDMTTEQIGTLWSEDGVYLSCLYALNWTRGEPPVALMLGCREDRIQEFRGRNVTVVIGDVEIPMGECDWEGKAQVPWPHGLQLHPRILYRREEASNGGKGEA